MNWNSACGTIAQNSGGCDVNVGERERWASLIGGGLLAAYGLLRGSALRLPLVLLGGALAYRGYTGHCQVYEALGRNTASGMA